MGTIFVISYSVVYLSIKAFIFFQLLNIHDMIKNRIKHDDLSQVTEQLQVTTGPISQPSVISKVLKRIIRKQVSSFIDKKGCLNSTQHGFRSGHSCLSVLLRS